MNLNPEIKRAACCLAVFALTAACGDDGESSDEGGSTTMAGTTTGTTSTTAGTTSTTTDGTTTTDTDDTGSSSGDTSDTDPDTGSSGTETGAVCEIDICAMYGPAVPAVVSQIVDAAATDPQFEDDFAPLVAQGQAAIDAFKASLTNFISDAYECSVGAYTGPSMEEAHAGLDITDDEYVAFVTLIAGILSDNGVPDDEINNCFAPVLLDPSLVDSIVGQ